MVRLLVVDDHPLVRRGIVEVLAEAFPGSRIAEASGGAEALQAVHDGAWDLVVLDLSMPGKTGLDVLKEIRSAFPRLPVLILSTYPEQQFATRVLRAGASGYAIQVCSLPVPSGTSTQPVFRVVRATTNLALL